MFTILKVGTTPAPLRARRGDFEDWFRAGLGLPDRAVRVIDVPGGQPLPGMAGISGVLITGSAAMVTRRQPWADRLAAWVRRAVDADFPLLGVCYGHQILAFALGGRVGPCPGGYEIGTFAVELTPAAAGDPLFAVFQGENPVSFQFTHREAVVRLPGQARRLAGSRLDPHAAFAVGERIWGVQFHPEFDADIIRGYLRLHASRVTEAGLDADALCATAHDTAHGRLLLQRFASLCAG